MKKFTVYYTKSNPKFSVDNRNNDLNVYTAKIDAPSKRKALSMFKKNYMSPYFVDKTKKVKSNIKVVKVF